MATVKENKETITRSRLVGLKDICVAAVTTNDEDVYAADVPVRLAKAIAATVKDTFSVEYTYSDDEVEDTVETYEKTEIELEVNRLTPGDYALLFDTLYKYGFLAKAEGDKAKEVALGFRAKQGNGKYEFSWYYCGKAEHPDVTYETVKDKKTAQEKYDELLDEALEKFKKMLESNSSLYDYVYNTVTVSDEDTEDDILRKITEGA